MMVLMPALRALRCRWGMRPIQFFLPDELAAATQVYVERHRPLLAAPGARTLFVTLAGDEFEQSGFCSYWKSMLAAANAQSSFPPRLLRHIWVRTMLAACSVLRGAVWGWCHCGGGWLAMKARLW